MRDCEIAKFESYPAAKKGDHHKATKEPRLQIGLGFLAFFINIFFVSL